MPHINTNPGEGDPTVSAFLFRRDSEGELRALLHRHLKIGKLLQIGGHVDKHLNPWQAMAGELDEEAGYDIDELQILQPIMRIPPKPNESITHPTPFSSNTHPFAGLDHFHSDWGYLFLAQNEPSRPPHGRESKELLWLSEVELHEIPDNEIPPNVRSIFDFGFKMMREIPDGWELVEASSFDCSMPD